MEWLVFIWILILVLQVMNYRQLSKLRAQLTHVEMQLNGFRVRQGKIASRKSSSKPPGVDAKARTVRRDTDDLPATGRMSNGLHMKMAGGSHGVRISNDG